MQHSFAGARTSTCRSWPPSASGSSAAGRNWQPAELPRTRADFQEVLMNRLALALSLVMAAGPAGRAWVAALPAAASAAEPAITVLDEAGKLHRVTASDISRLNRRKFMVTDYDSDKAEFEGVSLVDFLQPLGVVFGKELKGP